MTASCAHPAVSVSECSPCNPSNHRSESGSQCEHACGSSKRLQGAEPGCSCHGEGFTPWSLGRRGQSATELCVGRIRHNGCPLLIHHVAHCSSDARTPFSQPHAPLQASAQLAARARRAPRQAPRPARARLGAYGRPQQRDPAFPPASNPSILRGHGRATSRAPRLIPPPSPHPPIPALPVRRTQHCCARCTSSAPSPGSRSPRTCAGAQPSRAACGERRAAPRRAPRSQACEVCARGHAARHRRSNHLKPDRRIQPDSCLTHLPPPQPGPWPGGATS